MQTFKIVGLFLCLLFVGCETQSDPSASIEQPRNQVQSEEQVPIANESAPKMETRRVSLSDSAGSLEGAIDRKIIRNADLAMEVQSPPETLHKITAIAESLGGFVVSSDTKQRESGVQPSNSVDTSVVIRVPSVQFLAALEQIRGLGSRVIQEKVASQDVTEEFIDLEARLKTQKALEQQFLEIMKRAGRVSDALEVQSQIAEVRTEIERIEGRKRFLESRSALSNITVNLRNPEPIVASSSGFGREIKDAARDGVKIASAIVLFVIRFAILMVPVLILVVLPGAVIGRFVFRRLNRAPATPSPAA